MKPQKCLKCSKGDYTHGSAIYDYYSCGHAYEKPLTSNEQGKAVYYESPYEPYKSAYKKEEVKDV